MPITKKSNNNVPATKADFASLKADIADMKAAFKGLVQVVTSGFREIDRKFATKEDLKNFATKEDLKNFATKEDLKQTLRQYATKDDLERKLDQTKEEITMEMKGHFTAAIEIIESDLKGAHKDEIEGLQDHRKDHEERITILEKHTGVRL